MKKTLLTLVALLTSAVFSNAGLITTTLDFGNNEGFATWGTGYTSHTLDYLEATVYFDKANKQQSGNAIDDCPVSKGSFITVTMKEDCRPLSAITLTVKRWGSKDQTIEAYASTDGENFAEEACGTLSVPKTGDFDPLEMTALPAGCVAVKFVATNANNQIGWVSVEVSYGSATEPKIAVANDLNLGTGIDEAPASKTLTVTGANLTDAITYTWQKGAESPFTAEGTLTAEGGTLTVSLNKTAVGNYEDVLTLASGSVTATVNVTASIVTIAGTGSGTEEDPYDVTRALDILEAGAETAAVVYVKGVVTDVEEVSTQYGNATFNIGETSGAEAKLCVYRSKYLGNEAFTSESQVLAGDNVVVCGVLKTFYEKKEITNGYIVSTDRTDDSVATPVISPATGTELTLGDTVTITCATEGAVIYYTLDGTVPSSESTEYTEPILMTSVTESITVKAIAYLDGKVSEVAEAEYSVVDLGNKVKATFTNWPELFDMTNLDQPNFNVAENSVDWNAQVKGINLNVKNGTSTNAYLKTDDFRAYNGYTLTFTAPTNYKIVEIDTEKGGKKFTAGITADCGNLTIGSDSDVNWKGKSEEVVWTISGTVSFKTINVTIEGVNSAVEGFETEAAETIYYNLQGVRVDNPSNGIFIVREGKTAKKVLVK